MLHRSPVQLTGRRAVARLVVLAAALLVPVLGLAGTGEAAIFAGFDPERHNRFTAEMAPNGNFLLAPYDLSGVAVDTTDPDVLNTEGAILITSQHYLTSSHFRTRDPMFLGSDGVLRTYATEAGVNAFTPLTTTFENDDEELVTGESDLVIGRLAEPIPTAHGVSPVALLEVPMADDLIGREVFAFGDANQAGRNIIDLLALGFQEDAAGEPIRPTILSVFDFDSPRNGGEDGLGDDEIGLAHGDSSHGLFIDIDGELVALGVHFSISVDEPSLETYYQNYTSLASAYLDQIETIVGQHGESIRTVLVPEPTGLSMLGLALPLLGRRRHPRPQQ